MIIENEDDCFSINDKTYTLKNPKEIMILKEICIKKKPLSYFFIGGMIYSKNKFSLDIDISLPYPFTSYYTLKILDKKINDKLCRSLIYAKFPLLALQFEKECISIKFDSVIQIKEKNVYPFISLEENKHNYIIKFYLFGNFDVKEKKNAWLGFGKKKKINLNLKSGDSFNFSVDVKSYKNWKESTLKIIKNNINNEKIKVNPQKIFLDAKKALWRSYDDITGSFLQLPWRKTTNFALINSSYSLMSYEAVRLNYFFKWYKKFDDKQFLDWSLRLRDNFVNDNLLIKNPRIGEGIIWYNMTNLTRSGLKGYFYMDCGYSGYPGGQASISYSLIKYLEKKNDVEIEKFVKESIKYIISTQKDNGAWPMAIHQKGLLRYRPEKLNSYETYGGTAECVRVLFLGYKRFNDQKMKDAAINGLNFLMASNPICYNGLRDIGINEPEAFSAISIINAFLDGYDNTKNKIYLDNALNYAYYSLTWFYINNLQNNPYNFNFHPISFSITPRISPYENFWIVSCYMRIYNITKDKIWNKVAIKSFNSGIKWITKNGGVCEGVFPTLKNKFNLLPMEQTFATTELMNASTNFFDEIESNEYYYISNNEPNDLKNSDFKIERKNDLIDVYLNEKKIFSFNYKSFKILYLKDAKLNNNGISLSIYGPYLFRNILIRKIKKYLRGDIGKIILGFSMIKYFLYGVYNTDKRRTNVIHNFEKIKKINYGIKVKKDYLEGFCETDIHRIDYVIKFKLIENKVHIIFCPFIIKTLAHDVNCNNVIFPLIGKKIIKKKLNQLHFSGFTVIGNFKNFVLTNELFGVDQTLATNWTHGGIFRGDFKIILN
jgi:hypothetical protein